MGSPCVRVMSRGWSTGGRGIEICVRDIDPAVITLALSCCSRPRGYWTSGKKVLSSS